MTNPEDNDDRRQLLIRVGRYAILGGISVLSLNLFNRVLGSGCVRLQSPCQTCGLFDRCALPKAEASKQELGEEGAS
jgi:hypothetical protein